MSKNRNKKLRNIVVNGENYKWLVSDFNCDGDYSSLVQIYKNKQCVYKKLDIDDELTEVESITPKTIESLIIKNKL